MKSHLRRALLAIVILAAAFGAYRWNLQRKAAAQVTAASAEAAKLVAQTLELAPSDVVVAQGRSVEEAVDRLDWEDGEILLIGSSRLARHRSIFLGSTAEAQVRGNALAGTITDYELSFEGGEKMRGKFLVQRLDYAGDFNGERNYTMSLESSGVVVQV